MDADVDGVPGGTALIDFDTLVTFPDSVTNDHLELAGVVLTLGAK